METTREVDLLHNPSPPVLAYPLLPVNVAPHFLQNKQGPGLAGFFDFLGPLYLIVLGSPNGPGEADGRVYCYDVPET